MEVGAIAAWITLATAAVSIIGWVGSARFRRFVSGTLQLPHGLALGWNISRKGIRNFYSCRNELNRTRGSELFDSIKGAKTSIGIVAISLQQSIAHQKLHKDLENLLVDNPKLTVIVSLVSPSSPLIPHLAAASGRDADDLRAAIKNSLTRLKGVQSEVNTPKQQRLVVKTCAFHYFSTLVAVDVPIDPNSKPENDAFFLIEHSLYGISISERYTLEIGRPGSQMFRKALASYRAIMAIDSIAEESPSVYNE